MTVEATATMYGPAAVAALRKIVAAETAADPLAPVTVLVPNNIAGLFVRRSLARGVAEGRPGIAGIFISTLPRLAEQLAAGSLHPRTPATATVVAAAWRSVLDEAPGIFEAVADHPATIRALVSAHRELRDLSDTALDAVRDTSPLHAGLIELHRTATARIASTFYDETDLLTAATGLVLGRPEDLRRWGRIVLYLPQRLSHAETRLARALTTHTDVTVLAGLTGDTKADAAVLDVVSDVGGGGLDGKVGAPANAGQVIYASDSDDEVRRIVREVIDAIGQMPAHRIAVLHSGDVPYAAVVDDVDLQLRWLIVHRDVRVRGQSTMPDDVSQRFLGDRVDRQSRGDIPGLPSLCHLHSGCVDVVDHGSDMRDPACG